VARLFIRAIGLVRPHYAQRALRDSTVAWVETLKEAQPFVTVEEAQMWLEDAHHSGLGVEIIVGK
jgi:hypothetical protein